MTETPDTPRYRTVGITLHHMPDGWVGEAYFTMFHHTAVTTAAELTFKAAHAHRTEGPDKVVDALIAETSRLGLAFDQGGDRPQLLPTVGWDPTPAEQRTIATTADRLGWQCPFTAPVMAWLRLDANNRVGDDSTIIVEGREVPVPSRCPAGTRMAPRRIGTALRDLGWRQITDADHDTTTHPGYAGIPVQRWED